MLLFMTPWAGQSVDRVYELAELYAAISVDAACRLISIWRNADLPRTVASTTNRPRRHRRRRTRAGPCPRARAAWTFNGMSASAAANDRKVFVLTDDLVEEMPPGAILNLDDPYVGIETHFARETFLDLGLGGRQFTKASDEELFADVHRQRRFAALVRTTRQSRRAD